MHVINIVDSLGQVNFGIWNAALNTAPLLARQHQVHSEVWYCSDDAIEPFPYEGVVRRRLFSGPGIQEILKSVKHNPLPGRTVIVSHGCWQYPTNWAYALAGQGHPWVYVPHGMLNRWSRRQKKWKKIPYWHMMEKPKIQRATAIRAVGSVEYSELDAFISRPRPWLTTVPNGIDFRSQLKSKSNNVITFLFMARLNYKKGIIPLLRAWLRSELNNQTDYRLLIAGPDDGEGRKVKDLIRHSQNSTYLGAVYGPEKERLLEQAHFFVLPSFNEGFPTAVLEAVNYGLIPLISQGTNFPEILDSGHAIQAEPNEEAILEALREAKKLSEPAREEKARENRRILASGYAMEEVARGLFELYEEVLARHDMV